MRLRRVLPIALAAALAVAAPASASGGQRPSALERSLLKAVQDVHFEQVLDFDSGAVPAPQVAFTPNADVAVFALNPAGRVTDAANVLLSRDYPSGALVPIDGDLGTRKVRYHAWDIDRWNGDTAWDAPWPAGSDLVPGREGAPLQFMSPYPASLFKVLVAYGVLRLVDGGVLTLDTPVTYDPPDPGSELCGDGDPITRPLRDWIDPMISESNNQSTCAMLKLLHDQPGRAAGQDGVDVLNQDLAALGLQTLQVNGTDPATGGTWNPGQIDMGALDTARFFYLVSGAPGQLWRAPSGRRVTAGELSPASRAFFQGVLRDQGFREVLSTTNYCGLDYPAPGIPARVADRWIQPDGTVVVDGIPYPSDVRPCNDAATVDFLDKTGLTYNYGSDAGIVHNLPGKPYARYIVAILTNLGYRYGDPQFAGLGDLPCFSSAADYVCYTEKFSQLGLKIHESLTGRRGWGHGFGHHRGIWRPHAGRGEQR